MSSDTMSSDTAEQSSRALLIEPWKFMSHCDAEYETRKRAAIEQGVVIDPKTTKPFELLDMAWYEEVEIAFMYASPVPCLCLITQSLSSCSCRMLLQVLVLVGSLPHAAAAIRLVLPTTVAGGVSRASGSTCPCLHVAMQRLAGATAKPLPNVTPALPTNLSLPSATALIHVHPPAGPHRVGRSATARRGITSSATSQ